MKIHRRQADSDFAQIPNGALRDRRLSWKARGLLAYLLSHTDEGFSIDADRLVLQGPDGRAAILSGLKELVEAGYVVRTKRRDQHGHWHTDVDVYDHPKADPPTPGNPTSENRTSETSGETAGRTGSRFSDVGKSDGRATRRPVNRPSENPTLQEDQEEDQEEEAASSRAQPAPEAFVAEATGATPDEARAVVAHVFRNRTGVRSPVGLLRRIHKDGELAPLVADLRRVHRLETADHCPVHRGQLAASCGPCRSERLATA